LYFFAKILILAEKNYYHFFIDGLTQLRALDEFDPDGKIPLIVPDNYRLNRFVADYFENIYNSKRQIITQSKSQYYFIKELYLFKEEILSDSLVEVINQFDDYRKLGNLRKIFITRNYSTGRTISNMEELIPILEKNGFETIESTELSLLEQVKLFSTASHIIGIHGAGLVNSIFKKGGNFFFHNLEISKNCFGLKTLMVYIPDSLQIFIAQHRLRQL
jgi:capsular polysaccharide biosynthesis protein